MKKVSNKNLLNEPGVLDVMHNYLKDTSKNVQLLGNLSLASRGATKAPIEELKGMYNNEYCVEKLREFENKPFDVQDEIVDQLLIVMRNKNPSEYDAFVVLAQSFLDLLGEWFNHFNINYVTGEESIFTFIPIFRKESRTDFDFFNVSSIKSLILLLNIPGYSDYKNNRIGETEREQKRIQVEGVLKNFNVSVFMALNGCTPNMNRRTGGRRRKQRKATKKQSKAKKGGRKCRSRKSRKSGR